MGNQPFIWFRIEFQPFACANGFLLLLFCRYIEYRQKPQGDTLRPLVLSVLPEEEVALFRKIQRVIDLLPDIELVTEDGEKIELSCHLLSRAIGKCFDLTVETGKYHEIYEHSWLRTRSGRIIDVYPVATLGGPLLIDNRLRLSQLYRPTFIRGISRGYSRNRNFNRHLREVDKVVKEALEDLER